MTVQAQGHYLSTASRQGAWSHGFTGKFFIACWPIIKLDLMAALLRFQSLNCQGLNALNSATMILLPKRDEPSAPGDYRPISLVHGFGKIAAKMLANRLQPFMPSLIAQCQNTFIKGRSIHDNFVLVQGTAQALQQKKIPSLMLKLDI